MTVGSENLGKIIENMGKKGRGRKRVEREGNGRRRKREGKGIKRDKGTEKGKGK